MTLPSNKKRYKILYDVMRSSTGREDATSFRGVKLEADMIFFPPPSKVNMDKKRSRLYSHVHPI